MVMAVNPTYKDSVYHLTIWFSKPSKAQYVGEWSTEWAEMMEMLNNWIQDFTKDTFGILSVNITKTEPASGVIFVVNITYWLHP